MIIKILDFIFTAIDMLSLIYFLFVGIFFLSDEVMGIDETKKLIKKLKFPLSYKQIVIISIILFIINFSTVIIRKKCFE